jgi:site-specific DNA-methyltransferase (adenine-specific)
MSEAATIIAGESMLDGKVTLFGGDNREVLRSQPDNSIDSIVTDPPYALVSIVKRFGKEGAAPSQDHHAGGAYARASAGFMGKQWDTGEVAFAESFWRECYRVLKPGGHVVAFSHARTYHRMACAIEDAGFEVRDQLAWLYGSGFPKNHDAALDFEITLCDRVKNADGVAEWRYKDDGAPMVRGQWRHPMAIEWEGWGTALKPAIEPICLARKPIERPSIILNLWRWFVGAINIDACRVGESRPPSTGDATKFKQWKETDGCERAPSNNPDLRTDVGRYPANVLHDGSAEVVALFPDTGPSTGGGMKDLSKGKLFGSSGAPNVTASSGLGDSGSAARFFYTAKADAHDRIGSKHPTVKPVDLMQWLVRLVTPKGGLVLDPFAGTGTTGEAAFREGMRAVLIEREAEYQNDIRRRLALALAGPEERARESIKAKVGDKPFEAGSLFAGL